MYISTRNTRVYRYTMHACTYRNVKPCMPLLESVSRNKDSLHTYVYTCIHVYIHTCIHTYMYTYIHKEVQSRACRPFLASVSRNKDSMHAYIHTYIQTNIQKYAAVYAVPRKCVNK